MRRSHLTLWVALSAAAGLVGAALGAEAITAARVAEPWKRPCLLAPRLANSPVVDGKVDTGVWDRIPATPLAFPLGSNKAVKSDTTFRAGHRDGTLFLLMEYAWPDKAAPKAPTRERDGKVWADDGGEVFLCPIADPGAVRHLLFNLAGSRMDLRETYDLATEARRAQDMAWNPNWRISCRAEPGVCRVEMAIPLADIGLPTGVGSAFRFDLLRTLPRRRPSILHWAPIAGRANCRPEFFGVLVLAGRDPAAFRARQLAAKRLDGIVFPESRIAATVVPGARVSRTLLNPLAAGLPGGMPVALRVAIVDAAGKERVARNFLVKQWPQRFTASTAGLPDGDYRISFRARRPRPLDIGVSLRLRPWVVVEAENRLACKTTGPASVWIYPRTTGGKVVYLRQGARLTVTGFGRAIYVRLPIIFETPGPHYGHFLGARLRWRIDGGKWQGLGQAAVPREVALAENLSPAEHTLTLEPIGSCCVDGFRFAARPVGRITGMLVARDWSELLTDCRADVFRGGRLVRVQYVRSPHDMRFVIAGLDPGKYRLRLTAAGWGPVEVRGIKLPRPGAKVDVGVVEMVREDRCVGRRGVAGPRFGRTINVQPGGVVKARIEEWGKGPDKISLVSPFRTISLKLKRFKELPYGKWNAVGEATFQVPPATPRDMYDLRIELKSRWGKRIRTLGQAVCVREALPARFYVAGCGHMNTWGQKTSEYLRKVGGVAELAGARCLLVSNEVNAAYVCGGLTDLRIPYLVTRGNHTMSQWDTFYGTVACDDGPMRIVTFGDFPYRSWRFAEDLLMARPEATNRIVLCFEPFAPIELIRGAKVDLLFNAHSNNPHPDSDRYPKGTLDFRAPNQHSLRWITMTHDGLDPSVRRVRDVPVLDVPREGPPPLRVAWSAPNDGTADRLTATVTNGYRVPFPNGRLRFVLRKGKYRVSGGKLVQSFDADDGKRTIVDVTALFPTRKETRVTVEATR